MVTGLLTERYGLAAAGRKELTELTVPGADGAPVLTVKMEYIMFLMPMVLHMIDGETDTKTDQKWLPVENGVVTAVYENGVVTLYNVEGADGPITLGAAGLNNLIVIPDYVSDEGGALPVLNFAPLQTSCGEIAPNTIAKFRVSPSNATVDLIDIENLAFIYNNPKILRSSQELVAPTAEFKDLKDGILYVYVGVNTDELAADGADYVDEIQLVAP